jgi:hypothetical protein
MKKLPKTVKRGRGRPRFIATDEMREGIEWRMAMGWSEVDCADEIGIATPTLRKVFAAELRRGRLRKKGRAIDLLVRSAEVDGNVSAQKTLYQETQMTPSSRSLSASAKPKLGKKEAANIEAQEAEVGTGWGDLLAAPDPNDPAKLN